MSGTTFEAAPFAEREASAVSGVLAARYNTRIKRAREARLKGRVLLTTLACALPPALLLGLGHAVIAGRLFWLLLAVVLLRLLALGRAGELLCVLVAVSPLLSLFRDFAFYNVLLAVLGLAVLFAARRAPKTVWGLIVNVPLFVFLAGAMSLYWVLSYALTGSYSVNFRVFELIFTVLVTLLLATRPLMMAAALRGLVPVACATGLAMFPHLESMLDDRLGIISVEGYVLGNPSSLGVPLALGLLALVVDDGRALGLRSRPILRILGFVVTASLLALTTSRAAWLVGGAGLLVSLLLGRRSRRSVLVALGIGAVVLPLLRWTPFGTGFERGLDRTFGGERSLGQRTTGRSDQWRVAYVAVTESAGTLLHGYGPGSGSDVYARYSLALPDVRYEVGKHPTLHSLVMQVGVETGLVGLVPLAVWLGAAFQQVWRSTRRTQFLLPLVCLLGYFLIVLTVSGNDVFSGLFLGIALSATARQPLRPGGASSGGPARRFISATIPSGPYFEKASLLSTKWLWPNPFCVPSRRDSCRQSEPGGAPAIT